MKRRVSTHLESWQALIPFRTSRRTAREFRCVVCEIDQDGIVGRGEALGVGYFGETEQSMLEQLDSITGELVDGADRQDLLRLLPPGGARFAADAALWDLEAKQSGRSAWKTAGVSDAPIETAFTIGLEAEPENMAARAAAASDLALLKIKLNADRPVERVAAIRDARPDARLFVDANEAWSFAQLRKLAPALAKLDVLFIEQPLQRGKDDVLDEYTSPLPLCADESVQHLGELHQTARRYQMINIKLDKAGGLTHGLELAKTARDKDLSVMVGCMGGTSLCMAPHHVIAQLADFADIDGPLLLKLDRPGGLLYERGIVSLTAKPFWGA